MKHIIIAIALSLVLFFAVSALASTPPPPLLPGNPPQAPIDGGLGLLALAGGAYALKRLRKNDV